jgi:signal transduction histidine kinase
VKRAARTFHMYWAVVALIAVVFGWWMVYFVRHGDILVHRMAEAGQPLTVEQAKVLLEATASTTRMLMFEGAFLGLMLLASVALVLRSMQREMRTARRQQNFLSAVTHELKSPLASARLYVESLELGRADGEKRQRYLKHAREDLDRLRDMIEDLLQSARLSTTGPELIPSRIELAETVDRVLALMKQEHVTNNAEVSFEGAPVHVNVDGAAVETVVRNLLSNAVKYGGEPAHIDVRVGREDDRALLVVRDHGPGLNGAKDIFDPFVRGGDEMVRTRQGVGLGLYLVDQLVRASGGSVHARDDLAGGGLSMEIRLPVAAETEREAG